MVRDHPNRNVRWPWRGRNLLQRNFPNAVTEPIDLDRAGSVRLRFRRWGWSGREGAPRILHSLHLLFQFFFGEGNGDSHPGPFRADSEVSHQLRGLLAVEFGGDRGL